MPAVVLKKSLFKFLKLVDLLLPMAPLLIRSSRHFQAETYDVLDDTMCPFGIVCPGVTFNEAKMLVINYTPGPVLWSLVNDDEPKTLMLPSANHAAACSLNVWLAGGGGRVVAALQAMGADPELITVIGQGPNMSVPNLGGWPGSADVSHNCDLAAIGRRSTRSKEHTLYIRMAAGGDSTSTLNFPIEQSRVTYPTVAWCQDGVVALIHEGKLHVCKADGIVHTYDLPELRICVRLTFSPATSSALCVMGHAVWAFRTLPPYRKSPIRFYTPRVKEVDHTYPETFGIAISAHGDKLAVSSNEDGDVDIIEIHGDGSAVLLTRLVGDKYPQQRLVWAPSGDHLAACDIACTTRLFELTR